MTSKYIVGVVIVIVVIVAGIYWMRTSDIDTPVTMTTRERYCNCSGMNTMTNKAPYTFWQGATAYKNAPSSGERLQANMWPSTNPNRLVPLSNVNANLPVGAVEYNRAYGTPYKIPYKTPIGSGDAGVGVL